MMFLILWTTSILLALWLYLRQIYSRFEKYGVKHFKPLPFVGNMTGIVLKKEHFVDYLNMHYFGFPEEKFVGRYEFTNPMILVRDLDLIKKITVKDIDYFLDHRSFVDEENDPFFGRNLFSLKGHEWKDMRSTLSPAFTSSKMRLMVPFMVEVGDQMIRSLKKKIEASGVDYIDIDSKDLTTRYANDVIASCAFGLKVDSHTEENNEFYEMGKVAANFKFRQLLMFFAFMAFPRLMKQFKFTLFADSTKNFFKQMVLSTMKERDSLNIIRPDMIHLLMEAKKGQLSHDVKTSNDADAGFATVEESSIGRKDVNRVWSDTDLVAQAVLFFIAGFETVSSAMTFLLHEMAVNPDVQDKLAKEIKEHWDKSGGKLDYTSIQHMTYMDMVVSEVLRLWSPAIALDRLCTKDYNLGRPNSNATQDYIIRKGEGVSIPVWSIHRDPEYFPDPLKFDPERFSEENKHKIKPFTYSPFGLGPRNCIGSRFALCEVKVMVYQLLLHMEVSPAEKTTIPVKLAKETFNLRMEGGHWIRMKVRN